MFIQAVLDNAGPVCPYKPSLLPATSQTLNWPVNQNPGSTSAAQTITLISEKNATPLNIAGISTSGDLQKPTRAHFARSWAAMHV